MHMHVMCEPQHALPTLFSTKCKFYKRAFSCKFLWDTVFVSNIFFFLKCFLHEILAKNWITVSLKPPGGWSSYVN